MNLNDKDELLKLRAAFLSSLTDDVLPFWLRHGLDREHGGILTGLDRDGSLLETDKSVWFQGRAAWTFASAFSRIEARGEWLAAAESCLDFLEKHCFDGDGRMFFRVTREGAPVVKRRRYVFSETFAIVGMAAFSSASGEARYADAAFDLLARVEATLADPAALEPKFSPATRPSRGLALPMILMATMQELRRARPSAAPLLNPKIDAVVDDIERNFMRPDLRCVLEQTGPDGEFQRDHLEGRLLNPGHAIEAAWFVLQEARCRGGDPRLVRIGTTILDWMWEIGWDKDHGGIIYFRDALGLPPSEYWHDMKFWWPQNEAIIANLMAFAATKEPRFAERFRLAYEWAHERFPDREKGEWFGYLHRDGTVSTTLKGNMYKGPFHVPRMQIVCAELLAELAGA